MQLRLRTKLTLVMTGLVFLVVVVLSGVYFARLTGQVIQQTYTRRNELTKRVFAEAKRSLADARQSGLEAASASPDDRRDYVRQAFERNEGLSEELQAPLGANAWMYDVMIVDKYGMVLASSDPQMPGTTVAPRPLFTQMERANIFKQMKALYGPQPVYEVRYPFTMAKEPFGEVRVGISISLLRNEILPSLRNSAAIALVALLVSTGLAMVVSGATLAPLQEISTQLDRISAGQFDAPVAQATGFAGGADELGLVSKKISQVGQQLRGVHEIFSTMRENLNSVMAGLEDGLLLFTRDARAVMVSPAAEKFLGAPSGHFLGKRVTDIFPEGHPLRQALHLEGDEFSETAAETELETSEGTRRVGVSGQAIHENGEKLGALVTLRDLDSTARINTHCSLTERVIALRRIT